MCWLSEAPEKRAQIVAVELWPYETTRAAVQGVLSSLVEALSQDVGVVGLRGLPSAYSEIIGASGGLGAALVRMQGLPSTPRALLERIDEISTAIGARYIVWIEDLERFAGGAVSPGAETAEEAERLAPLRALLLALDGLDCISVITATRSLDQRFDLEKIARYVELLPALAPEQVASILASFRAGCLGTTPIVDAVSDAQIGRIKFPDGAETYAMLRGFFGHDSGSIGVALPKMVTTPRALKQGLRQCLDTWEKLRGEIDFDDLLVMSLVRVRFPNAFSAISRHIDFLRDAFGTETADREVAAAWENDLVAAVADERDRALIHKAIEFVFSVEKSRSKPQGLSAHGHADYWRRFLDVPELAEHDRDQPILRTLVAEDNERVLALVLDPTTSTAVEDFANKLTTRRVVALFEPLVRELAQRNAATWNTTGDFFNDRPPGLTAVWRMWLDRSRRGEISPQVVTEAVKNTYQVAVPRNLDLVDEIEHWFVSGSGEDIEFFRGAPALRAELKQYLRTLILSTYEGKPDALAGSVRGAAPAVLLRLSWGLERVRAKDYTGIPFDDWPKFAATILDAARMHPDVMLPQVAALICREEAVVQRDIVHQYVFDEDLATRLFGATDAVLVLFVGRLSSTDERVSHAAAVAAARNLNAKRSCDPGQPGS